VAISREIFVGTHMSKAERQRADDLRAAMGERSIQSTIRRLLAEEGSRRGVSEPKQAVYLQG